MLDSVKDWLFSGHLPYISVFSILLAAGLGFPLPEDIPLLAGGYICHRGLAHFPTMLCVAMLGILAGDSAMFYMGRIFGRRVTEHRLARSIATPKRLAIAEALFARHGIKILFVARFVPGLRSLIFLTAGVLRVPFYKYLAVNGFAALISVPLLVFLGYHFGENIDDTIARVKTTTHVIGLIIITGLVIAALVFWHRRQKRIAARLEAEALAAASSTEHTPENIAQKDKHAGSVG